MDWSAQLHVECLLATNQQTALTPSLRGPPDRACTFSSFEILSGVHVTTRMLQMLKAIQPVQKKAETSKNWLDAACRVCIM